MDRDEILTDTGRRVCLVLQGDNGEWYPVPLSRESHAYPLDALDNIRGTGYGSPEAVLAAEERTLLRQERR